MGAKPDPLGKPDPANARVTALTSITELRLVDLRVARDTGRARARSPGVASVVAGLALRLGVAASETQARMIATDVRDLGPIGLVVTRGALGAAKPALMGIFVARHAVGLEPEERLVAPSIASVVAVLAS
jgi:hypothetical protein